MRRLALTACLLAATSAAADTLRIEGLHEQRFNPLQTEFSATLEGGRLSENDDDVSVLINGEAMPPALMLVRDRTIRIDATFTDGVNDVLVLARTRDGEALRADALVWAGGHTLVVDVVDAAMEPVGNATVRVSLASNTAISARSRATNGTARFEHLPAQRLLIEARSPDAQRGTVATNGDAGSVLVVLEDD